MRVLVVGAAASGKSEFAESLACAPAGRRCYIATMRPYGEDGAAKVARHLQLRDGKGFETVECYDDLQGLRLDNPASALVDCVGNLATNVLYKPDWTLNDADESLARIVAGITNVFAQCGTTVFVSNDVGADGCTYDPSTAAFQRFLGRVNCALAEMCDLVVEVVCGQPNVVKGAL